MQIFRGVSRGLVVSLLAAWVCAALAAGDVSSSNPTVTERLETARQDMKVGNWQDAMFQLGGALREDPRNPDVHNLLGYYYRKKPGSDLAKAFEHYGMALKLDPDHKGTHEYIGEAYLMDNQPAQAEKHLAQLEAICGNTTCEEYEDLAAAIARYRTMH